MNMPAFNLKQSITKKELMNSNTAIFIGKSVNNKSEIQKNVSDLLENPKIADLVQKLSKE